MWDGRVYIIDILSKLEICIDCLFFFFLKKIEGLINEIYLYF